MTNATAAHKGILELRGARLELNEFDTLRGQVLGE